MNYLPKLPTSTAVLSLWVVLACIACVGIAAVYWFLIPNVWLLLALLVLVVACLTAVSLRPSLAYKGHVWIARAQRAIVARGIQGWINGIVFFGILFPNQVFGRRLAVGSRTSVASTWGRKEIVNLVGGGGSRSIVSERDPRSSWVMELWIWIRDARNGNIWMAVLIPFMMIMCFIDDHSRKTSVSTETYTLY